MRQESFIRCLRGLTRGRCVAYIFVVCLIFLPVFGTAAEGLEKIRLKSFALRDQFNRLHQVHFPGTNIMVVTVADRNGSAQVDEWIAAFKMETQNKFAIKGVADVSNVPGFLKSMVQEKFAKARSYPVMLDWDGEITSSLRFKKNVANIYLLGKDGTVHLHLHGKWDQKSYAKLLETISELQKESSSKD